MFHQKPDDQYFRFNNPELVHFCLLRGVRMVSALNASIELARCGFPQEIGVLLRTNHEYSTQIDFMFDSRDKDGNLSPLATKFLRGYFDDDTRGPDVQRSKKAKLVQETVHKIIGERLDAIVADDNNPTKRKPAAQLFSHIYFVFSNYVHARYPEAMDLYGGRPGLFHMRGMRGTPKDAENITIIEATIKSASNCLKRMIQELRLHSIVSSDPMLSQWYNRW